jgi:SAM-dependent methyltransferase
MAADFEWDDTLFKGSAAYYRQGRLPYAPGLADAVAEALKSTEDSRLLDVGCGPGTVALILAPLFGAVVGVDPDPGMIAEAERDAAAAGLAERTRWLRMRAEDLPAGLGTFSAVAFGNAFHWMDRAKVAASVRDMLVPGGALIHVADLKSETRSVEGLPHPAVPAAGIDELVKRYLGPVRRAGRSVLPNGTPGDEVEVLAAAGFAGPEQYVVAGGEGLVRSQDDVVAATFSMSFSAPHLFGERLADFEADLRALLRAASPSGRFSERLPSTELRIWRKAG